MGIFLRPISHAARVIKAMTQAQKNFRTFVKGFITAPVTNVRGDPALRVGKIR